MMAQKPVRGIATATLLLAVTAAPAAASHDTPPGMTLHETRNELGTMAYHVYAPAHLAGPAPLFVHLHGANNKTVDAAHRSRLNELASQRGFVVVYPQENPDNGRGGVWNHTEAAAAGRDGRATSLIAQITREVAGAQPIDPRRVFIGGISAGAGIAIVMAAQYPDLYSALQAEVGARYGEAGAAEAGRKVFEVMGSRARRIPLVLSYGSADPIAAVEDQESVVDHWLIAHDWMDDGAANGSVSLTPAATRQGTDGKSYVVDTYVDTKGCVLAERWLIEGLAHAYSGGGQTALYDVTSDPKAPNMREVAYHFFLDQLDGNGPPACSSPSFVTAVGQGRLGAVMLVYLLALAGLRRLCGARRPQEGSR